MEGTTRKILLLSFFLTCSIFASSGVISYISSSAAATSFNLSTQSRYKTFDLLDFTLKDGTNSQSSSTVTLLINTQSDKGSLTGQSTLSTATTPPSYSLSVQASMKESPATGKKYRMWLKSPTGSEFIPVGESTTSTIRIDSFTSNRDLTGYTVVVSAEDASSSVSSPSTPILEGQQQRTQQAPTAAPQPTTGGGGGTVPTSVPQQTGSPTSAPSGGSPISPTGQTTAAPTGSGGPLSGEQVSAEMRKVIQAVKEENIRTYLENLVDDDNTPEKDQSQNRYSGRPGNIAEAAYIKSRFESMGLEASYQDFTRGGVTSKNIIGKLYGKDRTKWYMVMAHMDSTGASTRGWSSSKDPAPGADDNGSGTATVLGIAQAFSDAKPQLDASIMFVLWSGEEQGLNGSYFYTEKTPLVGLLGIINLDMIGNRGPQDNCVNALYKPRSGGNLIADEIVATNQQFNIGLTTQSSDDYVPFSDHHPFVLKNIMGSFMHECTKSPRYHTINDKTDVISYTQLAKTAQAVSGTLVKVSHTKLGSSIAELAAPDQILGVTDADAPLFLKVSYTVEQGPDALFELADVPIDYYEGQKTPVPFFLGLFSQSSYENVQAAGYRVEVLDTETDLSLYQLVWYPGDGGEQLAKDAGVPVIVLSPHVFLLKFDKPHAFVHDGPLGAFFELPMPTGSKPPLFKTPRITPVPTAMPAVTPVIPDGARLFTLTLVIVTIFIAAGGAFIYLRRLRTQE